ncbi:MAG: trypsin-like serine protease [Hyphomicrobiaceae bacterium]|nr:trypsin-like serine protease [Hyphomicrobiaceae bacterium]
MPPRGVCRRALGAVIVLGLGGIAWPAHAQGPALGAYAGAPGGEALLYQRELDLSLNATPTDAAEPSSEPDGPPYDRPLRLDALVPGYGNDAPRTRVVHGIKADRGQWPSAVSLSILKDGVRSGALCAGTVIDSHWVLTAAHCVFDRYRGGVRSLRAVTAYTKSNVPQQGEPLRVRSVIVHPQFAVLPRPAKGSPGLINDIALLELERTTTAPRQKLLAGASQPGALAVGTIATVVGWGLTKPRQPDEKTDLASLSKVLLRADIPVAERGACDAFLDFPSEVSTEALFCAGDSRGGADACNGDSGGPIFVEGPAGQPLQAGVVSWGDGCAVPGTYGAYTAVGHFETWIRQRVPHAQWIGFGETPPALAVIAGAGPGGPAAPYGQITADLQVHPCKGVAAIAPLPAASAPGAANRVKVGSCITVLVTSGATGDLAVFNRDATGDTRQIFPNRYASPQVGQAPTSVRAGQVVRIPGDADGFNFRVTGPVGRNEIIAIVVPHGADLAETTRQFDSMGAIDNFEDVLTGIAVHTRRVEIDPRAPRAVGTREFEVVE